MNGTNKPQLATEETPQVLKVARAGRSQLTQLAEHEPEAADQNPTEGLHRSQPQPKVRFQRELAGQSAPSEYGELKSPDTMHIRNSHDLNQASVPKIRRPLY
jgi:hypothetical protein